MLMPRERQNTVRMRSEIIRDRITVFQTASVIDQRGKTVIPMVAVPCAFRIFLQVQVRLKVFFGIMSALRRT